MTTAIEALNTICPGWTESESGMLCSAHDNGGIIDSAIVSGEWFVIHGDGTVEEGFDTREDAIEAFVIHARAA